MARPIILSNGSLHVGINKFGLVHDFYYPRVGLENHAAGQHLRHKVGIWIDGNLSWLDDDAWAISFLPVHDALIGRTIAKHSWLGVTLEFDDFVASDSNAFFRNIHIINHADTNREIRLFMHQAFVISDSRSNTDTAQYLPDSDAILHYRGRRAFVVGGSTLEGNSFDQRSIGLFGIEGREGTYRDADDGELSDGTVEHGRVDSTLRFSVTVSAHGSTRVHYWIACGRSVREAVSLHAQIQDIGLLEYESRTFDWWHKWLEPARKVSESIDEKYKKLFLRSALLVKAHTDNGGAVIASSDSTMLNYSRDAYAYCWPRDGALAMWPLIRMGYRDEPLQFFEFCQNVIHPKGYLSHKFMADGSLGPSWHPYAHEEGNAPPIQEDETAAVLFVFDQFYWSQKDRTLLEQFYEPFVKPMAKFLEGHIDDKTGLPLPSYDLWEENYIVSTYTTALTQAALRAGARLAEEMGETENAVAWRASAETIQRAAAEYLVTDDGILIKGIRNSKLPEQDQTLDLSSFYGAFIYGLFPTQGHELTGTLEAIQQRLRYPNMPILPRYQHDAYHRVNDQSPPNAWFITTLWIAQYYIEIGDDDSARAIIDWVNDHTDIGGILSEQITPGGEYVSVSPLTWSHAEFLSTLLDLRQPT